MDVRFAMPEITCSVCGRNLTSKDGGSFIGLVISVTTTTVAEQWASQFQEVYPELKIPLNVNICYVCWLKSLGVKV